jgi:hypothetical protein
MVDANALTDEEKERQVGKIQLLLQGKPTLVRAVVVLSSERSPAEAKSGPLAGAKSRSERRSSKMSRVKVTAMALFAVIAMSAVAVSSASAEWLVSGKALSGTAPLTTAAVVDAKTKLLVPSVEDLTIECAGSTLDGVEPRIEGTDRGFASSLTFLACSTINPATNCKIESQPVGISTNPILALAALKAGEEDKVTFTPETGKVFASIAFSTTNTCAFNGVEGVKGSVTVGAPGGTLESETHSIVGLGSVENNSLEVANSKAYLIGGNALLKLASGSKWSFM